MSVRRVRTSSLMLGTALVLVACGGGSKNPAAPPSSPVPSAAPTPTPAPSPSLPFGITGNCYKIGMGSATSACRGETPSFDPQVEKAIDMVVAQHPEVFDLTDERGAGGYLVTSLGRFYLYVTQAIEAQGNYCAVFDGEEVAVKDTQTYNDQYKLVLSDNHVRRGPAKYRATCYPAAIPTPVDQPPPPAGCKLATSHSFACGREEPKFDQVMEDAIAEEQQTHPDNYNGDEVKDWDAYLNGVAAILTKKGYCAVPGEEVGIKNKNDFSESYDILLSNGKIRHDGYRVTCWPADF